MMPPVWKVKRELRRIWNQISHWPVLPFESLYFSLYSWARPEAVKTIAGFQHQHKKSAVLLIYQPDGLQQSTLSTCKHLDANGYAVRLVSNAPLAHRDIDQLRPHCWRITERPNHGYDFGGYQHAIREIMRSGETPERLLLLNDSIWFPLTENCTLLRRLEGLETDLSGPVFYRHRTRRKSHLQSYMILLSSTAVQSDAFRKFWERYAMSNSRHRTIRNGEMRLTQACVAGGMKVGYLLEAFSKPALATLSGNEIAEVAAYDRKRLRHSRSRRNLPAPESELTKHKEPIEAGYVLTNHPVVNLQLLNLPLLKKDRDVPYRHQRLAVKDRFLEELKPVVRAEILNWDRT